MSCPDSGSDDNVISLQLVQSLGIPFTSDERNQKRFSLANGKVIHSIGTAMARCNFAHGTPARDPFDVFFYVFETLAAPVIIGMMFLQATETFSQYRDRLEEIVVSQSQVFRIQGIDTPMRDLLCLLGDDLVFANADSGSDLDLMSAEYATRRGFRILPSRETIMFADGSVDTTSGVVRLPFSIEELDSIEMSSMQDSPEGELEFHVYDKLVHNVLIGHGTIEARQIFIRTVCQWYQNHTSRNYRTSMSSVI